MTAQPLVDPVPHHDAAAGRRPLRRPRAPWVLGAGVAVSTLVLAVRDPHVQGSYGVCPLLSLTGVLCPACGALRATHDLAHGDLAGAWALNPLWVVLVPLLVAGWGWWAARTARGRSTSAPPAWVAWTLLTAVVLFGVLRNIPALAPALGP